MNTTNKPHSGNFLLKHSDPDVTVNLVSFAVCGETVTVTSYTHFGDLLSEREMTREDARDTWRRAVKEFGYVQSAEPAFRGLQPMRRRGPVTWKKSVDSAPVTRAGIPRRHQQEVPIPDELAPVYAGALVPGSMFAVAVELDQLPIKQGTMPPPFPVLVQSWTAPGFGLIRVGTIAVYVGQIRVEERGKAADSLRVIRHTFIISNGQYIVQDLNTVRPVLP